MTYYNNPICRSHVHPAGVATIILFTLMSYYLYKCIQLPHEQAFRTRYGMRYQQDDAFTRMLETGQNSEQAAAVKSVKSSPREVARCGGGLPLPACQARCLLM